MYQMLDFFPVYFYSNVLPVVSSHTMVFQEIACQLNSFKSKFSLLAFARM